MSLLLDALKKAAEQKAEKSRQETAETRSSDETVVDVAAEDVSGVEDDTAQPPRHALEDETEINVSDLDTRTESTPAVPADGTETDLEVSDPTETRPRSAQMQTGEDETIIFADEDVADFMGEPQYVSRDQRSPEDETDLSQLAPQDHQADVDEAAPAGYGEETDLSQLAPQDSQADVDEAAPAGYGDETDLSQLAPHGERTDVSEVVPADYGDETDLSQLAPRENDTDISQPFEPAAAASEEDETSLDEQPAASVDTDTRIAQDDGDETDISVPPHSVADLEHAAAQHAESMDETDLSQTVGARDDTGPTDDDLSLLLVERDQTNLTEPTSVTDPQTRPPDTGGDEELELVDTTRHRLPPEGATATATTNLNQETQTTRSATGTQTSTRTYAPDNYDRTLMRLPSDDASKLFAGMKSDSDVVMTPEYAKKVFQSKSSAQRMQQYRIYGGITLAILAMIAVYGLFEYMAQQDNIDTSLRPLKHDPMPGLVRIESGTKTESLFAEGEVDERAISVIESAESGTTDEVVMAEPDESAFAEAGEDSAMEEGETATVTVAQQAAEDEPAAATQDQLELASIASSASQTADEPRDQTAAAATAVADSKTADETASSLQISSSERLEQKHVWLREAYAAYRGGNDELAMKLYNQVLEADPVNRNALLGRAAIHVQNNNSAEAIRDYQKLLLANPRDPLAMTSLITVANYSPQETETQLKLMIRDDPDSPYLNFALANAYGAQDRWREAQGHYYTALQNNPGDPNYAYNLAVSLEHISQPRAAMAYYRRALDNFDKGPATFNRDVVDQRLEVLGKL